MVRSGGRGSIQAAYRFLSANQDQHSVATLCGVLQVSESGYHAWKERPPSQRAQQDANLSERIQALHARSKGTYGVPRVHAQLAAEGLHVSRKRVARLMSAEGLQGASRRKWCTTTVRDERARPAPDLGERDFTADGPDKLWGADITYVPTWAGFLYLAVVLDVWSRRIVGWAMAPHLRTELVLQALDMALKQRRPTDVIHKKHLAAA
ncbi:MAG: IS3 family transposase [Hyalangium sp.]|uniref:IS3 family transposase n=1 Tax=Hyalangium sp. TaxID=2028555 RepID=UPI00389B0CFF